MKILVYIALLFYVLAADFISERLNIVDRINKNYLIRGNLPITNQQFNLDLLMNQLEKITFIKTKKQKITIYSLMNRLTDKQKRNLQIEQKYFAENPTKAQYYNYPVLGFVFSPLYIPNFIVSMAAEYYQSWSYDKLDQLVTQLHDKVKNGKENIVYFHCSAGIDRTGLVAAAYKMKYLGQTFQEVYKQNKAVGNRDMQWNTFNGLLWYCEYLKISHPALVCKIDQNQQL